MQEKKVLRKELLQKRENYTAEQIDEISRTIFGKVKQLQCFEEAKTVMIYVSYGKELNTFPFIKECIQMGKQVLTPICNKDHTMTLALTKTFPEGFVSTKMGILEIPKENAEAVSPDELDVIITPGLAFTLTGERLGYGGGYYDRLFARMPQRTVTICPTFDDFILKTLPTEEFDRRIDILLSEKRTVFLRKGIK